MLQANLGTVFLLTAVVILGKFAGSAAGAILVGEDRDTAVKTGCGMAQVNEFALIIAALGVSLKATRDFVYPVAVSVSLLTTFINPYLLRHMDALSGAAERLMPRRLRLGLAVYNRWAVRVQRRRINDAVLRAVRRSVIVIAVNLGWVAAIFLGARFLERTVPRLMAFVPEFLGGARTGFWLAAALLVAPFLVATLRKLKALGMVLAEIKFPPAESAGRTAVARLLTEMAVLGLGGALLGLYILMLGSAILPPWPVLIGLLAALAALTRIFWTLHIRLYARAQHALHEVLSDTQDWFSQHPIGAMPYFFREARLGAVILSGESRVAGRVIRELNLRAETGATIIGIDRGARTIINPDSDETFHSGDRVLLLGTDAQIERARIWMRAEPGGDA